MNTRKRSQTRHLGMVTLAVAILALTAGTGGPLRAAEIDPHALYETRCASCHEAHARDLAKATLELKDNVAHLKGGGPLAEFLTRHPRRPLAADEAAALATHLAAMLQTGFIYQEKCTGCHDRAVVLARRELIERDGVLVGRYTGRNIEEFLANHGRLTADEAATVLSMLHRQLRDQ